MANRGPAPQELPRYVRMALPPAGFPDCSRLDPIASRSFFRAATVRKRSILRAAIVRERQIFRAATVSERQIFRASTVRERLIFRAATVRERLVGAMLAISFSGRTCTTPAGCGTRAARGGGPPNPDPAELDAGNVHGANTTGYSIRSSSKPMRKPIERLATVVSFAAILPPRRTAGLVYVRFASHTGLGLGCSA